MEYSGDGFLTKKIQRIASDIFTADHFSKDGHVTLNVIYKRNCSAKAIVYDNHRRILEECILDKNYQPERDTLFCNDVTAVQYCHDIVECHVVWKKLDFKHYVIMVFAFPVLQNGFEKITITLRVQLVVMMNMRHFLYNFFFYKQNEE